MISQVRQVTELRIVPTLIWTTVSSGENCPAKSEDFSVKNNNEAKQGLYLFLNVVSLNVVTYFITTRTLLLQTL